MNVYLMLVYLLAKTVIDRSSRYISYMESFGFLDNEILKLYARRHGYGAHSSSGEPSLCAVGSCASSRCS